ncbi:hypothetical protein SAMN04487948_1065 [Halogranum amylolyticum]|uniref:Acetyl-CoA synthetase n=1 Tax=Halogranum amylolyticum TaxID=660520 RepID=A0A1H8T4E9_9EURY|nr:hypothetical protein [Halogranum amylolyticum]SEO85742.1 hypothetical protein SAMN04487948_1065 [Halogranum amylolyticum]
MNTLGDLVARDRRSSALALRVPSLERDYSYHDFCTTAWKAGNFLSFLGVRGGGRVAIEPDPLPEPLLTFFGAALHGATTAFDPSDGDVRAVVVPQRRESEFADVPGTKRVVYGGPPTDPGVSHWEKEVWSENPAFPPTDVDPATAALAAGDDEYSHRELLRAADHVVDDLDLTADDEVVVRSSLAEPGVVAAGVLAPLSVGSTVVFPDLETDDSQGSVAVADADADVPERRRFLSTDVL